MWSWRSRGLLFRKRRKNSKLGVLTAAFHTFIYSLRAVSGISKQASGFTHTALHPTNHHMLTETPSWGGYPDTRTTRVITVAFSMTRMHPGVDRRMRPLEIPWKSLYLFVFKLLFLAKNSTLFVCKSFLLFPILQTATLLVAHCEVHLCTLRISLDFHYYVIYKTAHGKNTHRNTFLKSRALFVRVSSGNHPWVQWWVCFVPAIHSLFDLGLFLSSTGL